MNNNERIVRLNIKLIVAWNMCVWQSLSCKHGCSTCWSSAGKSFDDLFDGFTSQNTFPPDSYNRSRIKALTDMKAKVLKMFDRCIQRNGVIVSSRIKISIIWRAKRSFNSFYKMMRNRDTYNSSRSMSKKQFYMIVREKYWPSANNAWNVNYVPVCDLLFQVTVSDFTQD